VSFWRIGIGCIWGGFAFGEMGVLYLGNVGIYVSFTVPSE
jgi:hypothetical protein